MKESARAARDELAHNRCVAALKALAGEGNAKVLELEDLRTRRLAAPVSSMMEREIMADVLEGLHRVQVVGNFTAALERARVSAGQTDAPSPEKEAHEVHQTLRPGEGEAADEGTPDAPAAPKEIYFLDLEQDTQHLLTKAGFDTIESVREASDKDLLAIENVGKATLAKIREAVNADRTRDTPDGPEAVG